MFASDLWRADQQSFVLYPIRELPGFLQKNQINEMAAMRSATARRLLKSNDRSILHRDVTGQARFNASFRNASDVAVAIDAQGMAIDSAGRAELLDLYEETFGHHAFTGRSGTMYGYEGIGCVYWHMVAKLLLAIQENLWRAVDEQLPAVVIDRLCSLYARVRAGLGFTNRARLRRVSAGRLFAHAATRRCAAAGHDRAGEGREILTRFGELGVRALDGTVRFAPLLLSAREFFTSPTRWHVERGHEQNVIDMDAGMLGFTFAGTPIVYTLVEGPATIDVRREDGSVERVQGDTLTRETSRALLSRDGSIARIDVSVPRAGLCVSASLEHAVSELPATSSHTEISSTSQRDLTP